MNCRPHSGEKEGSDHQTTAKTGGLVPVIFCARKKADLYKMELIKIDK